MRNCGVLAGLFNILRLPTQWKKASCVACLHLTCRQARSRLKNRARTAPSRGADKALETIGRQLQTVPVRALQGAVANFLVDCQIILPWRTECIEHASRQQCLHAMRHIAPEVERLAS